MSDCFPFAIHVVTGLPVPDVMEETSRRGWWSRQQGMSMLAGWSYFKSKGIRTSALLTPNTKTTLRKFILEADAEKTFIVSTLNHVLTIRRGEVIDLVETSQRCKVQMYIEVEV